jgi:NitT/TauT family transport system substrate-binding protein
VTVAFSILGGCGSGPADGRRVVRLGHFPNVTHAHGLLGHHGSRNGDGVFERHLGPDVKVEWYVFNAGPSAMEAMLAGSLDATYVGPNPALNAYTRSRGREVRIISGATDGGAALVVRGDAGIEKPADLRGRRVATPQFGNTQDVACRAWLRAQGFAVTQTGGDVTVVPTENPEQLVLFQKGEIDAAWTVEPWVSRLLREANGRVLVEEAEALTTVLACSAGFLAERPDLAKKLAAAHRELTSVLHQEPAAAQQRVVAELTALTKRQISAELIAAAWPRLRFTDIARPEALTSFVAAAKAAGLLTEVPDISGLVVQP